MSDERYTFTQARTRLEEIVTQVRRKECSLEQSLDLLEEGVRLANVCTELSDHTEWQTVVAQEGDSSVEGPGGVASHESEALTSESEDALGERSESDTDPPAKEQ